MFVCFIRALVFDNNATNKTTLVCYMEMDEAAASQTRQEFDEIKGGKSESNWNFYRAASTLLVSPRAVGLLAAAGPWLAADAAGRAVGTAAFSAPSIPKSCDVTHAANSKPGWAVVPPLYLQ